MIDRLSSLLAELERGVPGADVAPRLAECLAEVQDLSRRERILREVARSRSTEVEDMVTELSVLTEIGQLLAGSLLVEDPLPAVVEVLRRAFLADRATLYRLGSDAAELYPAVALPVSSAEAEAADAAGSELEGSLAAWVASKRDTLMIGDIRQDGRFHDSKPSPLQIESVMAAPLVAGDRLVGALVFGSRKVEHFRPPHVRTLHIVSTQLATSLVGLDLHQRLRSWTADLETDVESRTAELTRKSGDLGRKNEVITDLYLSLEEAQRELEDRNRDAVRAVSFLDSIVENVSVGIGVIRGDGCVLTWNRAMEQLTEDQLQKDDVIGQPVHKIAQPLRDDFGVGDDLDEALTAGSFVTRTSREVTLPSGRTVHLNASLLPVPSPDEDQTYVMVVLEDVSANNALHAQEIKTERLAAINETMVSVNHEVNNPLAVILGYTQMVLQRLDWDSGTDKTKSRVRDDLARIEAEALRIRDITAKLAALIEPVITDYPASGDVRMVDLENSR